MIQCKCTPIQSCMATNGCNSNCDGSSPSGTRICDKPNWSMYDLESCEHNLFQSQLCEITDISGFAIEYRVLKPKHDYLFGEDPNSRLSYPALTKCIYAPETESSILNLFGLTADDVLQYMTIPKAIFTRDLTTVFTDTLGPSAYVVPRMGDVITTLWNNRHYEITSIDEEQNVFMGKKFTWDIVLKPFRFSEQSDEHREVHTGVPEDPFENTDFSGYEPPETGEVPDLVERGYFEQVFGDNENIEEESDEIHDYKDPDEAAFGA